MRPTGRLTDCTTPPSCASGTRPSPPICQPCSQHTPVDPFPQAVPAADARKPVLAKSCSCARPTDRYLRPRPSPLAMTATSCTRPPVRPYHPAVPAVHARPPVHPHYLRTPHPSCHAFARAPSLHLRLEHLSPGSPRPPRHIDSADAVQRPALYNGCAAFSCA